MSDNPFQRLLEVRLEAEGLLGARAWALLSNYGKLMEGPKSGFYVSGLAFDDQLEFVHRLVRGETVPVHLMHRHRSGNYEASCLKWTGRRLVMVFDDREELA
jgi:hypothetical protein